MQKLQLRFYRLIFTVLPVAVLLSSCQKELRMADEPVASHNLTLTFKAVADTAAFAFGKTFTNQWLEDYTITAFKFYIAQIQLINSDSGTTYYVNRDEYFLVNFADDLSLQLKLKSIPATFNRIQFLIGVDSIRNVSGAQTGALDPAKGMFWTWNSGYIMAKLEGTSPVSTHPGSAFEYHIGGFSGINNVLRHVILPFPSSQHISLPAERNSEMTISADINKWFSGAYDLKLSVDPVCVSPGPLARKIADNYAAMFTVTNITVQ